jgi:O-antigen ligase
MEHRRMKWLVLLAMIASIPLMLSWISDDRRRLPYLGVAMGFLPFVINPWHLLMAPVPWALWPGYAKGMDITFLDAIALAVVLSKTTVSYSKPFKVSYAFYLLMVIIAIPQSSIPFASTFYVWQLLKMALIFAAISKIAVDDRGTMAIIGGLILGLVVSAIYAIIDRVGGAIQTGGQLGHQNLLGFVSHLVVLPAFALVLANRHVKLGIVGVVFGVTALILGASRGSIGFGAAGLALVYVLSVFHRPNGYKASWGLVFVILMVIAYPLAQSSLKRRFDSQRDAMFAIEEYDERAALNRAARMMIKDYPFGVGPNMYVTNANMGGYSQRGGVIWNTGSRSAHVHNAYLLINAETGYPGLVAFVCLLGTAIFTTFSTLYRHRRDPRSPLLVGIGSGLIIQAGHSTLEWMFLINDVQHVCAIALGLVAGLRQQMRTSEEIDEQQAYGPPLVMLPDWQAARRSSKKVG